MFTDYSKVLSGLFSINILDRQGRIIEKYTDHNTIVNQARVAMTHLISEGLDGKVITRLGVGTGTNTALPTDTKLTNMFSVAIKSHSFPDAGIVKFDWELAYEQANGLYISEFGLFCADGSLFSRKVREPIYKDSDLAFSGEWSIIF